MDLDLELYIDSLTEYYQVTERDTLSYSVHYDRSAHTVNDSLLMPVQALIKNHKTTINGIRVDGFQA